MYALGQQAFPTSRTSGQLAAGSRLSLLPTSIRHGTLAQVQQLRWRRTAPVLELGFGLPRLPSTASRATDGSRDSSSSSNDTNGASTSAAGSSPSAGVVPQPPLPPSVVPAASTPSTSGSATNGSVSSSAASEQPAAAAAAPSSSTTQGGWPHRWKVVAMIAVAFVLCNMDKVNMSVAVIPMAHELGWSGLERGLVSSSFFWGYTLTQIPGGYISTKIGGAKVLGAGVALWSLGTLIAPPAAQNSLLALCASRIIVGLGEGVAPSAATSVLAKIMPPNERSRAVATVWGGLDVGSAVGLLLCGPLIKAFGWPSVFYLFAVLGLVWCRIWPMFKPEEVEPMVTESMSIMDSIDLPSEIKPPEKIHLPWGDFFRSLPVWAVTVAHFCFNWGYYTLLAWLPSYFELALGLEVDKSSFLTLIPYLAMTAMMPLVGPMADGMVEKGMKLTTVRKICQNIAFIGPAICMIACGLLTPAPGSTAAAPMPVLVLLLSMAFAFGAWSRGGLYCNHQDLSPKYAGALLGITNTAGALPGVLGVAAAGYLLDVTNSWALAIFYPTALCQILGAVFYTMFASSERQSWS